MADALRARRFGPDVGAPPKDSLFSSPRPAHTPSKPSLSAKPQPQSFVESLGGGLNLSRAEGRVLLGLLLLGALVRFYRLERPSSVVFDEVHFGGFANKYIQSRFFMDVHPPLAKLLLALMAWLSGFEGGSFDFKDIGREYGPDKVPYIPMRLLPATLGLALIPLAYLTLRALKTRPTTALLGALMVMFENGLVTQSRFILLDSPLIFFTALTAFFWVAFSNENEVPRDRTGKVGPFSRRWYGWLLLTGLALGAVVSCKWVGLFTIATIGVLTIAQLWRLLGDVRIPVPLLARHFVARAVFLIVVPLAFYMAMFAIHLAILSNSGEGDGFMSSEFQHTLRGHGMDDTFSDVMIGSHVSIRHLNTQGGYLHSHAHTYPGGSKQQQITLYPHRDENNNWLLLNSTNDPSVIFAETHSPPKPIVDRTVIVLNHITTNKKLHSHDVRAMVTEVDYQNEVSAYGFDGFEGDANDHFMVEIDQLTTEGKVAQTRLQALRTNFRLRHVMTGCYLFSHKVKLPDWGFEQQEVTCNKNPSKENGLWYIETNTHAALPPNSPRVNYRRPGFFAKFAELQAVMWQTNAGLTDRHAYDSRPATWPFLKRGINFWVKDHRQVYLIGNPFVWWTSTAAVLVYLAAQALLILRGQRGYKDYANSTVVYYDGLCGFLALGWFLHYFPFFLMSRQLFLHHYFPALYFAILLSATVFDFLTSKLKSRVRLQAVGVIVFITVYTFWYFSPLTYAGKWMRSQCESAKWMKNWDFSCGDFPTSISDYGAPTKAPDITSLPLHPAGETLTVPVNDVAVPGQDPFALAIDEPQAKKSDEVHVPGAEISELAPEQDVRTEPTTIAIREREDVGVLPPVFEATSKEGVAEVERRMEGMKREKVLPVVAEARNLGEKEGSASKSVVEELENLTEEDGGAATVEDETE